MYVCARFMRESDDPVPMSQTNNLSKQLETLAKATEAKFEFSFTADKVAVEALINNKWVQKTVAKDPEKLTFLDKLTQQRVRFDKQLEKTLVLYKAGAATVKYECSEKCGRMLAVKV